MLTGRRYRRIRVRGRRQVKEGPGIGREEEGTKGKILREGEEGGR